MISYPLSVFATTPSTFTVSAVFVLHSTLNDDSQRPRLCLHRCVPAQFGRRCNRDLSSVRNAAGRAGCTEHPFQKRHSERPLQLVIDTGLGTWDKLLISALNGEKEALCFSEKISTQPGALVLS